MSSTKDVYVNAEVVYPKKWGEEKWLKNMGLQLVLLQLFHY